MKKSTHKISLLLALALFLSFLSCNQSTSTPEPTPEDVGLSSDRLDRIGNVIEKCIAEDRIAGAVTIVARHGKIAYFEAFGMMDKETKKAMQTDTIFRICSMTKPITSVAVMMLYEEGHFMLSDPVHRFIPEFKNIMVLDPPYPDDRKSPPNSPVKAKRPITIHHLLTHTSGLTYNWNPKVGKMYTDHSIGHGLIQQEGTIGDAVKRLVQIPLLFHPGDQWMYGVSDDMLGYLVEVVSGMTLAEFFQERIFRPLGMNDTYFYLSDEQASRLATAYAYFEDKGLQRFPDKPLSLGDFMYSAD